MHTEFSEALKKKPELVSLVTGVQGFIEAELGLPEVRMNWDVKQDEHGRDLLALVVRDEFDGQGALLVAPSELREGPLLRERVHLLRDAIPRVARWRLRLKQLYAKVDDWSKDFGEGLVVKREPLTIHEMWSGPYELERLRLRSNGHEMTLDPVGTWIIDADGQVDANGIGGPYVLLLSERDNSWFVIEHKLGAISTTLNRDTFLRVARDCLDA